MRYSREFLSASFWGIRPWTRHAFILIIAGFCYVAIGFAYILVPISEERQKALEVVLQYMPLSYWGFVFILAGLLTVLSSRWPPISKAWGYVTLTGVSAGWGASYFVGVLFGNAPTFNISIGLVWMLVAFMWWGISGLVNPDQVVVAVVNGPG